MVEPSEALSRLVEERRKAVGFDKREAFLKTKFPSEFSCWSNMKQRCATEKGVLHPEFRDFYGFLLSVGPQSSEAFSSIDRIDPNDPEYAPGKVRWATKAMQTRNRTNASEARCPLTDRPWRLEELAELQGVSLRKVQRRRQDGWTDAEVIAGYRCPTL